MLSVRACTHRCPSLAGAKCRTGKRIIGLDGVKNISVHDAYADGGGGGQLWQRHRVVTSPARLRVCGGVVILLANVARARVAMGDSSVFLGPWYGDTTRLSRM